MSIRNIILFFALYSSCALSQDTTIEKAKALADEHESSLITKDSHRLLEAQTKMVTKIMPMCISATNMQPRKKFLVVVKIDKNGKPNRSWLKGNYALSRCFEKGMKEELFFIPNEAPFYTSFDYTIKP